MILTSPDPFRLDGKVAAITGAGSGIGAAIALLFGQRGASVAVLELDPVAGARVVQDLRGHGIDAEFVPCDVTQDAGVAGAFTKVKERFGHLDILVNNAGIGHVGTLASTHEADFDRLFAVNVKGVFLCSKHAMPHLIERQGVICNLASIASLIGIADRFAYSMTKGAVLTMTKSVALDYMPYGVRCNCICPARIHTPFVDGYLAKNYPGQEKEMYDKLAAYQPMGRMGTPMEVAEMALFLCCDASRFVTGQALPLDGGKLTG
ncbi:MAG: glucose 1-dehydrogenase [Planctomycetes bacterium]|jgi:2-keto-3-deoxy-L-fuconate dehydrogenase|nr:glucose 1-dehydrogenase [Planctomycetota bacterium]MCC7061607.1 glucose 1-dehydrogenase [Planctomycetota bacterium]